MFPGTLILLGSPLLAPGSWGALPDALEQADPSADVLDVPVVADDVPPYGQRYLTSVVLALGAARPKLPVVLVAHSAAGPLLPGLGRALRDVGYRVGGYLFVDARLPGVGQLSRLQLLEREDAAGAAARRELLDAGGSFPDWQLPGVETRPRDRAFFDEPLPMGEDWPDAPCAYLRTSAAYAAAARQARARGWPLIEADVDDHVAWLADPVRVAAHIYALVERM